MKIAIMQPYFFPYLGYWQLMQAADEFVAFDDVNYIKRGWINRNRILVNGKPSYFTIPVLAISQNRKINDHQIASGSEWRTNLMKTLQHAYSKAPFYEETLDLVRGILFFPEDNLSKFLVHQLDSVAAYLDIDVKISHASERFHNQEMKGVERIIDMAKHARASMYINPPGARDMYEQDRFASQGLDLRILVPELREYPQRYPGFEPNLSLIDLLMEVGRESVKERLDDYELES